jgi:DNA-binding NarL/FixJ family response regulator
MPIRVLIADDHDLFAEALAAVLAAEGLECVAHARDGAEAVRLARTFEPDVVLMDVHMPGPDGIEATQRLRVEKPSLPVVMVSSSSDPDDVARAGSAGAVGYLVKDLGFGELVDVIRKVFSPRAAPSCGGGAAALP